MHFPEVLCRFMARLKAKDPIPEGQCRKELAAMLT
jgi:hypothetical protein